MVYNYDIGGNILSISKYDYTIDSECINPNTVITYTYDQNYKDRLITYKNEQVTYDENNNITSFDGCTLSYIKDKELYSFIPKNNPLTEYRFEYGINKVRTKKKKLISNSEVSRVEYKTLNDIILKEERYINNELTYSLQYIYLDKKVNCLIKENANGTSAKAITKFLNKDTSVWLGKIIGEYAMSGTVSGLYSLFPF